MAEARMSAPYSYWTTVRCGLLYTKHDNLFINGKKIKGLFSFLLVCLLFMEFHHQYNKLSTKLFLFIYLFIFQSMTSFSNIWVNNVVSLMQHENRADSLCCVLSIALLLIWKICKVLNCFWKWSMCKPRRSVTTSPDCLQLCQLVHWGFRAPLKGSGSTACSNITSASWRRAGSLSEFICRVSLRNS